MRGALRRLALSGIAAGGFAVLAAGCITRGHHVVVHTHESDLDLQLLYPPAVGTTASGRTFTCPGARSWLVRVLVGSAASAQWTYTLLYDQDATHAFGANGNAADETPATSTFALDLQRTLRVQVEGLDALPTTYVAGGGAANVVCRGIAEAADLVDEGGTTPPRVVASLHMLRVGAGNVPFVVPGNLPEREDPAAASLTSTRLGIGLSARGQVLFGGGIDPGGNTVEARVWRFDPATLSIAVLPTGLSAGRAASTATLVADSGAAAIVFAGGYDAGTASTNRVDVILSNGAGGGVFALPLTHAFHAAMMIPSSGAVVIAGGVDYQVGLSPNPFVDPAFQVVDVFAPPGSSACAGNPTCQTTALGARGQGFAGATPFVEGGALHLFLGGGLEASGNDGQDWVSYAPFAAATPVDHPMPGVGGISVAGAATTVDLPQVPAIDGRPLLFGGANAASGGPEAAAASGQKNVWFLSTTSGLASASASMSVARSELQAVALRDHSVAILGGGPDGDPSTLVIERFEPHVGANDDVGGVASLGESLLSDRKRFAAVALDGTRSWLDGAVLIVGSRIPSTVPVELYVPAYRCSGREVAGAAGSPPVPLSDPSLDDPCDLARPHEPSITDPIGGEAVPLP